MFGNEQQLNHSVLWKMLTVNRRYRVTVNRKYRVTVNRKYSV